MNWIELNNQVIIKDDDGKYQLEKDKEALQSYIKENIQFKLRKFKDIDERLNYLIENGYYDENVINNYSREYINNLYKYIKQANFNFKSYMSANKFYESYALKSNDESEILEDYEEKVLIVSSAFIFLVSISVSKSG